MFEVLKFILSVIWFVDVLDFPQFECLDTTYPINFWGWFLIYAFLNSIENSKSKNNSLNNDNVDCHNCKYKDYYVKNKKSNNTDSVIIDVNEYS